MDTITIAVTVGIVALVAYPVTITVARIFAAFR